MTQIRIAIIVVLSLVAVVTLSSSLYIVRETEQVVITQFGKPVGKPISTPGLKMKTPFVQNIHAFEKRFLEWDGNPNQIPTKDKRFIWVDSYARWRITDPLLFFQRLHDERGAQSRLDDILDGQNPERFLQQFAPLVRPCFSWWGAALWGLIVIPALLVGAAHWGDLTSNLLDRATAPQNLVLLWLLFPVIKVLHELGHAVAVKVFGGEVHEMGIMLLVLSPVPYVDASASSAFASKWQRAIVGAAGMIVELVLAAIAVYVWVSVEPGMVRTLA